MNILVDENIPQMTVQALKELGHDILDIRGTDLEGSEDEVLWEISQKEQRLLITTDMGFAQYRRDSHCGILIIRLRQPNRQRIHERILKTMSQDKKWEGLLVIMQDKVQRTWHA